MRKDVFGCLVIVILSLLNLNQCKEYKLCSTLHENDNFSGLSLNIFDTGLFPDLENTYLENDKQWNQTCSFSINEGCQLSVCEKSYFQGTCKNYEESVSNVSFLNRSILSVNCSCFQTCSCDGLKIRRSECARAYIERGCSSCNALYADLQGEQNYFPEKFENKVASILVKNGCQLTVYDEEDFEGQASLLQGHHENWEGDLKSYKCSCNDSIVKTSKKARPYHYPPLINIPDLLENITGMINGKYGRHPGLMAGLQSVKNKRSPKNAYILLLGLTGAGKSSAINLLFDHANVTKVGGVTSTTTDIHEFRIPILLDELGIGNSELRVIDTPGLCDTRGIEQDGKFLATLDEYLSRHNELSKYIPNVVLVFAKFNDNRIMGDGANFVKMLRGLDLLRNRIVDKKFSNVIFVLSHFMSEKHSLTRNPTERLLSFKSVIENYSLFPKPISIVVAENKPMENELLMMNGFFKLPNGEFYPRNLFEKIQKSTLSGGDPIGEAVIREGFKNSEDFNISSITFPLVDRNNNKLGEYFRNMARFQFQSNGTEVSKLLSEAFATIPPHLKIKFPHSLNYLQRSLNLRNINDVSDVPKTTYGIVKFLKETQLNPANLYLLNKAFSLSVPFLKEDLIAGHGFNVFNDKSLHSSPFKTDKLTNTEIGYSIPNILQPNLINQVINVFNMHGSMEDYLTHRFEDLDLGKSPFPLHKFKGGIKSGFNIYAYTNSTKLASRRITALREYRTFELELKKDFELNEKFVNKTLGLPKFNISDQPGLEKWEAFFEEYGTHVVRSVYGGGSIEITLNDVTEFTPNVAQNLFDLVQFAEDVMIGKMGNDSTMINSTRYSIKFNGGEGKFHTESFRAFTISESTRLLEDWKESLDFTPVILKTFMKLLPISHIVNSLNPAIGVEIQKAASALFNTTLNFIGQRPETLTDRFGTKKKTQAAASQTFFNTILKLIDEQKKSNAAFMETMGKLSRENEELQGKYEDDLKNLQVSESRRANISIEERVERFRVNRIRDFDLLKMQIEHSKRMEKMHQEYLAQLNRMRN